MTENHLNPEIAHCGVDEKFIERWALIWCQKVKHSGLPAAKRWANSTVPLNCVKAMKDKIVYVKQHRSEEI